MKIQSHKFSILLFLAALCAMLYFRYYDADGRLANHLLESMDSTNTGVVEVNDKGVITGVNANMEDLTGFEQGELRGRSLVDIMVAQARSKHPTDFATSGLAITVVRCKILRKDGANVPVVIVARIGGGRFIATVNREDLVIDHFSRIAQ